MSTAICIICKKSKAKTAKCCSKRCRAKLPKCQTKGCTKTCSYSERTGTFNSTCKSNCGASKYHLRTRQRNSPYAPRIAVGDDVKCAFPGCTMQAQMDDLGNCKLGCNDLHTAFAALRRHFCPSRIQPHIAAPGEIRCAYAGCKFAAHINYESGKISTGCIPSHNTPVADIVTTESVAASVSDLS